MDIFKELMKDDFVSRTDFIEYHMEDFDAIGTTVRSSSGREATVSFRINHECLEQLELNVTLLRDCSLEQLKVICKDAANQARFNDLSIYEDDISYTIVIQFDIDKYNDALYIMKYILEKIGNVFTFKI